MKKLINMFSLLIISASIAKAQSTFSANRPGQVDNPDITPKGNLMIEAGFQYGKTLGSVNYLLPTTSVRYGLNKSLELSLNADNIYRVETSLFGLTAYNIGSKIAICEETHMLPKIAFVTAYYLPFAGVKSLRPKNAGGLLQLAISHSIGDRCTIYSNLGATWNGNDSFPVYNYVVSLYLSPFSRFWTFAELYGLIPEKGENNMGLDCGFSYHAGDNFQVDFAIGADPVDIYNNHYVQIGAAFQIVRKDK